MNNYRLNRLFHPVSNRCFDVAIDHGFFGEGPFLNGIENIVQAVEALVETAPDAIQLSVGQARHLQSIKSRTKPALVLRTDIANVYGHQLPDTLFSRMIEQPVEQAVRLDACCVVVNLFSIPGAPEVTDQCIQNILKLKPSCEYYSMPLMIEPLAFRPNREAGGYMVDGDLNRIRPLVRQAVELGANLIKADPTGDPSEYGQVIEVAGDIPVLVRGGGMAGEQELLERTAEILRQGARGIVYGRNIVQHRSPPCITRALLALIHDGASVEAAGRFLEQPQPV